MKVIKTNLKVSLFFTEHAGKLKGNVDRNVLISERLF